MLDQLEPNIRLLKPSKVRFFDLDIINNIILTFFLASDALRLLPTSRIIASTPPFDIVQQRAGEITSAGVKDYRLTRAHRIVESYPNINSVLHSSVILSFDLVSQFYIIVWIDFRIKRMNLNDNVN